ncbi:MAG TPA: carboxymuconolactone decarboxylase family protein [Solirubrobacteraceae bacterium]|nr:carboxymuconolactone decarboxylase family protein [Solirubrobacteraceae bacterium]
MSTDTQLPTTARMNPLDHAGAPYAALIRVEERIELDATIRHLVKLRASILNGCAFCLDMHWAHAHADGESETRLAQVGTWHESPFFTARERAALALTDAITHVGESRVPDDAWAAAEAEFDPAELSHLVVQIAMINAWNRLAVTFRTVPSSYTGSPAAA